MKTITSVQAQNNFGALMDQALREPISITKHGKPRVFVISHEDFPEVGKVSLSELSKKAQKNIQTSRKLGKDAFRDF